MTVSFSTPSAGNYDFFLSVEFNFKMLFTRFRISCYGSQWNFKYNIFSICPCFEGAATTLTRFSNDMLSVFEMQQGPVLLISSYDDMSASSPITTIRTTFGCEFISVKMYGTCTTCTGAATDSFTW